MAAQDETNDSLPPPSQWLPLLCTGLAAGPEEEPSPSAQQARDTLQAIADSFSLSMLIKDRDGRRVFANRGYLKLFGVDLADILHKTDFDLHSVEQAREFSGEDAQVLRTGQEIRAIAEMPMAEGESRWIERLKRPLRDDEGNVVGVQVIFWDSTDRHAIQMAHDLERDLLHSLMNNIPDSIYFKDAESRFLRISRSMLDKFELEKTEDAIGKTDADIFTEEHAHQAREDELEIMRTGHPLVARVERETWPDREDTWASSTKMPLRNSQGEIVGTFGISRDVTELKRMQDELQEARDAASSANNAKSDFLANVSHEIRTPMNGIIGMTELLLNTELSDEQLQYQNIVKESAEVLLGLLNSILDFSKIEAGKFELEQIPFQLRDTLGATLHTLSARAAQKGLELAVRIPSDVPENLYGDPVRLRQIVVNLVGNAIKFTEQGEIVVEASVQSQDDGQATLEFSVRDTGVGIPKELQESIFAAFRQADTSTTRKFGGTGLGLAISSQLVSMMKGRLWVESRQGQGSTFFFTAHFLRAPETPRVKPAAWDTLYNLPVLIVDDNYTNRTILQEITTEWSFKPTSVEGGRQAIAELQAARERGKPYRLILLDVMMPEMDGLEMLEQLSKTDLLAETHVIILSSADRREDANRAKQLGTASCLVKPVSQSDLFDAISLAFDTSTVDAAPDDAMRLGNSLDGRSDDFVALDVLLAEDGIVNQKVAVSVLEKRGHHVTVANNGAEAVEHVTAGEFDVVLMDVQMPVMDGLAATAAIRKREQGAGEHLPIIAITAHAIKGDRQRCLDAGMDDYISKPFRAKELISKIERIAGQGGSTDSPFETPSVAALSGAEMLAKLAPDASNDQSAIVHATGTLIGDSSVGGERGGQATGGDSGLADSSIGVLKPEPQLPYDREAALLNVDGDKALLKEMAALFLQECPQQLQEIAEAHQSGDPESLSRAAHTMKGSAALFGAYSVRDAALAIEKMGSENNLSEYEQAWSKLNEETKVLLFALKQLVE